MVSVDHFLVIDLRGVYRLFVNVLWDLRDLDFKLLIVVYFSALSGHCDRIPVNGLGITKRL